MGFQDKNAEVGCHSLLQWTTLCQTSPPWPDCLGWLHMAWLSITELDKTVALWSDCLVFCDYGFSVSALWCPLATPTILLGFLLPWMWGISSQLIKTLLLLHWLTTPKPKTSVSSVFHKCSISLSKRYKAAYFACFFESPIFMSSVPTKFGLLWWAKW